MCAPYTSTREGSPGNLSARFAADPPLLEVSSKGKMYVSARQAPYLLFAAWCSRTHRGALHSRSKILRGLRENVWTAVPGHSYGREKLEIILLNFEELFFFGGRQVFDLFCFRVGQFL
jgi:hypothetical protein